MFFWRDKERNYQMKLMVASDIHGSAFYCKKMFEAFEKEKPQKLLLLGDLLYHGPRNELPKEYNPKQVISMLNEHKNALLCIRGNCDAEVDQMVLDIPILADYCILEFAHRTIYATHGHVYNCNHLLPLSPNDILLHGHTHVPAWETFGENNLYINPGSISLPKEGTQHSYLVIEDNQVHFKTLEGKEFQSLSI